jgi:hypothetical protein
MALGSQPSNDLSDAHLVPEPPENQLRPDLHYRHRLGLSGSMSVEHPDGLFCSENFDQLKGTCATEGHYHCPNNRVFDV